MRSDPFLSTSGGSKSWVEPAFLSVNKTIRIEASSIYYGLNHFSVYIYPEDIAPVADWLRSVTTRCGNHAFQQFHFFIVARKFIWADLYGMLPLVKLFAEGLKLESSTMNYYDIESGYHRSRLGCYYTVWGDLIRFGTLDDYHGKHYLDRSEPQWPFKTIKVPWFEMSYDREDRLKEAIQEAVELGVRANKEGWSEALIDYEFDEWFDEKIETRLGVQKELRVENPLRRSPRGRKSTGEEEQA